MNETMFLHHAIVLKQLIQHMYRGATINLLSSRGEHINTIILLSLEAINH